MRSPVYRPLSRDRVLDCALRLADEHGLDALSMRKLAAALGVEAMSLYNHVPGKPALVSGLLERLLAELEIPSDPELPWTQRLRQGATSFLAVAHRHPSFVRLLTSPHVRTGAALAPTDAVLRIFTEAGFDDTDAVRAHQALVGYVLGFILQQDTGTVVLSRRGPGEMKSAFDFGLDVVLAGLEATLRGR